MKIIRVGIDLAKNVFQVHGVDRHGKGVWKRRFTRDKWLKALLDSVEPGRRLRAHPPTTQLRRQGALIRDF